MQESKFKNIPKEYFRFIFKGTKLVIIYTDDGVSGGTFWEFVPCKK